MASFKDANGREWLLRLDGPTMRVIRKEADVDLANFDGPTFTRLGTDPCLLVDVIWLVCRKQAHAIGVTDENFGAALVGESLEKASDALLEALADFFPPRKAKIIREMIQAAGRIEDLALRDVEAKIAAMGVEATSTPSSSATSLPDLSELPQTD